MEKYVKPYTMTQELEMLNFKFQGTGQTPTGTPPLGQTSCNDDFCESGLIRCVNFGGPDIYTTDIIFHDTDCGTFVSGYDFTQCMVTVNGMSTSSCNVSESQNQDCQDGQGCLVKIVCNGTCNLSDDGVTAVISCPGHESCSAPLQAAVFF